jgi:hypothetical protein
MKLEAEKIPASVLPKLCEQLGKFGDCRMNSDGRSGWGHFEAGRFVFTHAGLMLTIEITENHGHFSNKLLIGGIRQLLEEAVEPEKILVRHVTC